MAKIFKAYSVNLEDKKVYIEAPQFVPTASLITMSDESFSQSDSEEGEGVEEITPEQLLEDARAEAAQILQNAQGEARRILQDAETERKKLEAGLRDALETERQGALNEATNKGYQEGHSKGEAAAQGIVDEAQRLKAQTLEERQKAIEDFEPTLVELVSGLVEKLVSRVLLIRPGVVLNLIRQGLSEASHSGDLTLRISKDDYEFVVQNRVEIEQWLEGGASLEITKDFSLNKGDCIIETPFGVIDASVDMQLDTLVSDIRLLIGDS